MPVAKDGPAGKMGQDSKAEKPNPGIIRRVRRTIGKSRKGAYSFHESSTTYGDIAPALPPSPDLQRTREDYYNMEPNGDRTNADKMNGYIGQRKSSARTSPQGGSDTDDGNRKMKEPCNPTNGYHDMESLSDPEDFESLRRGECKKAGSNNEYIKRGEVPLKNGNCSSENYSVPDREVAVPSENYSVPPGKGVLKPDNYSVPGNGLVQPPENYPAHGNDRASPPENGENFERQGAKPKVHYNKSKNGLRDTEALSSTKRQAVRVGQAKAIEASGQNYLNVDLADNKFKVEATADTNMSWQSSTDDDDDIQAALRGPKLPPLTLPPTSPLLSPSVPKTPHIEMVFRKDDLMDEEFEFATRAVGFRIEHTAAAPRVSSTTDEEKMKSAANRVSREDEEDPSEAGLLLMSQPDVSQHHEVANAASGGKAIPEDTYGTSSATDFGSESPPSVEYRRDSPPAIDRTSKPISNDYDEDHHETGSDPPPPVPPRIPSREGDDEPTHEAIMHFKPNPHSKSLSLPRGTTTGFYEQQELEQQNGSEKVPRRRVISSLFHKKSNKRHSTFSERPLPAIPPLQPGRFPSNISRQRAATLGTDRRLPPTPAPLALPPPETDGDGDEPEELPPPPPPKVPIKSPREIAEVQQILRARGEFASSLRKISDFGWYWGPMSWDDAETRLENTPDGSFLVRDSSDERHILSLSFRANGTTHHTRIEHQHGKFSFWSQPTSHGSTSVVDFIEEAMKHSHNGSFLYFLRPRMPGLPPAPVQLLYAISRFQKARSLQHMCRFVIRKNIRLDHIDQLPLPKRLKSYLAEAHYYTPEALEP